MKLVKLNNKGLTAVEILVCFVLMVILVVSMYSTVSTYKNKQNMESARDKIVAYKNLLTVEIQDDIIKNGLVDVRILNKTDYDPSLGASQTFDKYFKVALTFRNGSTKILEVNADYAKDFGTCSTAEAPCQNDKDDVLTISYGTEGGADYTTYPLPDLGYGYNGNEFSTTCGDEGCKIYDFRINNVIINTDSNIFSFYVGFYHPDFGTRYGIDIVAPINYSESSVPPELLPPAPDPEPTPDPEPDDEPSVQEGAACERGGNSICFITYSAVTGTNFAETFGVDGGTVVYDFDVSVFNVTGAAKYSCWTGANKGYPWFGDSVYGAFRCWEGSVCYNNMIDKNGQSASIPSTGAVGTIKACP